MIIFSADEGMVSVVSGLEIKNPVERLLTAIDGSHMSHIPLFISTAVSDNCHIPKSIYESDDVEDAEKSI